MSIKVAIIEDSKTYVSEVSHYLKTHDIEIVNIVTMVKKHWRFLIQILSTFFY